MNKQQRVMNWWFGKSRSEKINLCKKYYPEAVPIDVMTSNKRIKKIHRLENEQVYAT